MLPSVHLISLGCPKNLVDSEVMLGVLLKAGYPLEANPSRADVVLVNTCSFIAKAKAEAIQTILEAVRWRRRKPPQKLVVAGCLPQRYPARLPMEFPEVDAFIGINEIPRVDRILRSLFRPAGGAPRPRNRTTPHPVYLYDSRTPRLQLTPPPYAYLKIGDGCSNRCAYCAIPSIRGPQRSRRPEDVVREARNLLASGVRELILVSQDTTAYGRDLGLKDGLGRLLRRLNALDGDFWIRVLYTHPAHWTERLIETLAACPKVCRYVDLPLQHIHDDLLRRMGRRVTRARIEQLLGRLRSAVKGIAIRTTFLVGFPGETEARFRSLLDFVRAARFEHLGAFEYSREEGTPAARLSGPVRPAMRQERVQRLMLLQRSITRQWRAAHVGATLRVLVERGGRRPLGRSEFDAPEIDGQVRLRGAGWKPGAFRSARITGAAAYDWRAEATV